MFLKIFTALFVRGFGALSGFILSYLIVQKLPIAEAGYFFLSIAILSFVNVFNLCGMHISILRFMSIAHHKGESGEINGLALMSFFIVLVVSLATLFIFNRFSDVIALYIWGDIGLAFILLNAVYIGVPLSLNMLMAYWFQALSRAVLAVFFLSVNIPIVTAILLYFLHPNNADQVLGWYFFSAIGSSILCFFVFALCSNLESIKKPNYRKILKASAPLWVTSMIYILINWSGQFIASLWVDSSQIALLAIANRSAMLFGLLLVVCNMVLAPRYASLYSENKISEMASLAKTISKYLSVLMAPLVLVLIFNVDLFLSLFGENYVSANSLLIILLIGQLINVVSGSVGYLLNMSGNELDVNKAAVIVGIFVTILNLVLIPTYGVLGAAISTSVSLSVQNFLLVFYVNKRLGFNVYQMWRKV